MIDVYQTRRNYFLKCKFYKKKEKIDDKLTYESQPDGVFYARKISGKDTENRELANVFKFTYNTLTIETRDNVDINEDDIVYVQNTKWVVARVNDTEIIKNTEFGINTSKVTILSLRK